MTPPEQRFSKVGKQGDFYRVISNARKANAPPAYLPVLNETQPIQNTERGSKMIAPIEMKYTYVSAWTVNGGINLANSRGPQRLYSSERCRFVLTTDPDPDLEIADRGSAIGNLVLRALFTSDVGPDFDAELQKVMKETRAQRRRKGGVDTVLVAYGYGTAPVSLDQSGEKNGFVVVMDGVDKSAIMEAHREELESMKLALGFENASPCSFAKLTEGVYLTDSHGKIVYSINVSMSGRAHVSTGLSEAGVEQVSRRFILVHDATKLSSVKRLYSQMAEYENEPLRAFLFGWSALEMLIAKLFSEYERSFVSPILDGPQARLRGRFLDRVRVVMHDKYRLLDKSIV